MKLDDNTMWIKKAYNKAAEGLGPDVSISESNYKKDVRDKRTTITFRNSCYAKVTKNQHLMFLVADNKLYMREALPTEGFKLTSFNKDNSSCHTQILTKVLGNCGSINGHYDLEFDKECGFYYIDLKCNLGR